MTKAQIVPATAEMLKAHYGRDVPVTVRALAAVEGDKVLGIAGVFVRDARQIMFGSISDELRARPKALLRLWQALKRIMTRIGLTAQAEADPSVAAAGRFLEHIGFTHLDKGVYECRMQ